MTRNKTMIRTGTIITFAFLFASCNKPNDHTDITPGEYGKVILFADTLRVYDAGTGGIIAQNNRDMVNAFSFINCVALSDSIFYEPVCQNFIAINIKTGKLAFNKYLGTGVYNRNIPSYPIFEGDRLYVSGAGSSRLHCLNKNTGDIIWKSSFTQCVDVAPYYSTPVVFSDRIITTAYLGTVGDIRRAVYCVDKTTGNTIWEKISSSWGKLYAYPIAVNNRVILANSSKIFCLNISDGSVAWQTTPANAVINSLFIVKDGQLIFQTANSPEGFNLNYIDVNTGAVDKTISYNKEVLVSLDAEYYFVKNYNPHFIAKYAHNTNQQVWKTNVSNDFESPNVSDKYVYVNLCSKLLILDKNTGNILHSTVLPYNVCNKMFVINSEGKGFGTLPMTLD